MEALLIFFTGCGLIVFIGWLIICGIINTAAFGTAVVQYVKEDIEEYKNENAR